MEEIEFSQFDMKQVIGKGGFGEVWLAYSRTHGNVAMKKTLSSFGKDAFDEFYREVQILSTLNSPNIVRCYGIARNGEEMWIVMEYASNKSLFNFIQNSRMSSYNTAFPWSLRFEVSLGIARGLLLIHNKGIIHRDVKSLNVLLDNNMIAKVSDFGLSKIKTRSQSFTTATGGPNAGSLLWKAPETFTISVKPNAKSDIYALGIVFWEIASGEIPYDGFDEQTIRFSVQNGERPMIPPDCPPVYATLIKQCWHQDPDQRPNADTIIDTLEGLLSNQTPSPSMSSPTLYNNIDSRRVVSGTPSDGFNNSTPSFNGAPLSMGINQPPPNLSLYNNFDSRRMISGRSDSYGSQNSQSPIPFSQSIPTITPVSSVSIEDLPPNDSYVLGLKAYELGNDEDSFDRFCLVEESHPFYLRSVLKKLLIAQKNAEKHNELLDIVREKISWFSDSANLINADAYNDLGDICRQGIGIAKDNRRAASYYKQSADQSNAYGLCLLGYMYENGYGVEKDERRAFDCYQQSSDMGNAKAQRNLALMYRSGKGTNIDLSKTISLLTESSKKKNYYSMFNLGYMYQHGEGVPKDIKKANEWFKQCQNKGIEEIDEYINESNISKGCC